MKASDNMDITTLMEQKSFEELSATERTFALSELESAEMYREMRVIILETQSLEDEIPTQGIKANVMAAFDENEKDKTLIIPLKPNKSKKVWFALAVAAVFALICTVAINQLAPTKMGLAENKAPSNNSLTDSIQVEPRVEEEADTEAAAQPKNEDNSIAENQSPKEATINPPAQSMEHEEMADESMSDDIEIIEDEMDDNAENDTASPTVASLAEMKNLDKEENPVYVTSGKDQSRSIEQNADSENAQFDVAESVQDEDISARLEKQASVEFSSTTVTRTSSAADMAAMKVSSFQNFKVSLPPENHYTSY